MFLLSAPGEIRIAKASPRFSNHKGIPKPEWNEWDE